MDPERWRRLTELFHAALEVEAESRGDFLERACGGDAALRAEVESLLGAHQPDDDFLSAPAWEAGGLDGETQASLVGERLGPYAILEEIGRGGMGVVYLAEDTRLGRRVAVKALSGHLTRDRRSRERFRREARAAATLSHPGIATVHALEEIGDHLYIVYEHVAGRTLREEIEAGPLPFERLLSTALDIARALGAAHGQGIVHRDLKPENVIRTPDGDIKVLDFGLASLPEPFDSGAPGTDPSRLTLPGTLLGTPAYMAPEQLRGAKVDFRADQFAFGVLLYELASGGHPFAGGDPASTMARILEVEPAKLAERVAFPAELESIVERCLRKAPEDRYRATGELVEALERLELAGGRLASYSSDPAAAASAADAVPAPGAAAPQPATAPASDPVPVRPLRASRFSPLWWWRFHQLVVGFGYYLMLVPLWLVKESTALQGAAAGPGSAVFFLALLPVGVAGILRIHLWFTSRYYPAELRRQRRQAGPWVRLSDVGFVALLAVGAWLVSGSHGLLAAVLTGVAVGLLISFTMIEPTTARAAFRDR